jgi:hypothetical protein
MLKIERGQWTAGTGKGEDHVMIELAAKFEGEMKMPFGNR